MMSKTIIKKTEPLDQPAKKSRRTRLLWTLAGVGLVTAISLVLFIVALCRINRRQTPRIFEVRQIGATQNAVLVAWESSDEAEQFVLHGQDTDGQSIPDITCTEPFAAVRGLSPNTSYRIQVVPVSGSVSYTPVSLVCRTAALCHVRDVTVSDVTENAATVHWNTEGADEGFVAIAYALDRQNLRHLTSRRVHVPRGQHQCQLTGLLSNLHYTVTVMPKTPFGTVGKSSFVTAEYSGSYDKINLIRAVICPGTSSDAVEVHQLKTVKPDNGYKVSMIITGKTSQDDRSDFGLYITDASDRLISEVSVSRIPTNPKDLPAYVYRVVTLDFTSPPTDGDYSLYVVIDGHTIKREPFTVDSNASL